MMLFDRFKQVRAFVFAFEGVCAESRLWVSAQGDRWYAFDSRDRYALQLAASRYPVAVVGGSVYPAGVGQWLDGLGVVDLFFGIDDQRAALSNWMTGNGLDADSVLAMGSDMADLAFMADTGFGASPADAVPDVKAASAYISRCNGGAGAVRDVIEKVMKLQGTWSGGHRLKIRS
ncbi:KdsC family phosphatase [Parapedobacter soli]|uniref:KdsC family phosphatase n=1 Tax=Parapedobacter soli TaxID=416955 RepID=UPI0021C992C0|nr:hypothetical protein [Parapedobacter soli]